ncbi:MAG: helix-turn-helix domain-containing protein [Candidatus Gastranaerophilaceae bacterium]
MGIQRNFGLRIKELRKRKSITQEQFAENLGIDVRSLRKIEAGESFPSTRTLEAIISNFQIPLSELFVLEHLQPAKDLKRELFDIINSNPDKIVEIYKIVKAITS